jgi:hypothetical protein
MREEIINFATSRLLYPLTNEVVDKCEKYIKLIKSGKVNVSEDILSNLTVMASVRKI